MHKAGQSRKVCVHKFFAYKSLYVCVYMRMYVKDAINYRHCHLRQA